MNRYRLLAFFEDKVTEARVAQVVIVIAENDQAAIHAAKETVANDAIGGRVFSIQVVEKLAVTPGVVFRGDPYIPVLWLGMARPSGAPPSARP